MKFKNLSRLMLIFACSLFVLSCQKDEVGNNDLPEPFIGIPDSVFACESFNFEAGSNNPDARYFWCFKDITNNSSDYSYNYSTKYSTEPTGSMSLISGTYLAQLTIINRKGSIQKQRVFTCYERPYHLSGSINTGSMYITSCSFYLSNDYNPTYYSPSYFKKIYYPGTSKNVNFDFNVDLTDELNKLNYDNVYLHVDVEVGSQIIRFHDAFSKSSRSSIFNFKF